MKKVHKSMVSLMLILSVIFTIPTANVTAASKVSDTVLKKAMKCYSSILSTNPYEDMDGGFTAEKFALTDLDQDGIPELIINGDAPQIFSYNIESDSEIYIYNSWVYCTFYYSKETKNLMYSYEWRGKKEWSVYNVQNTQENEYNDILKGLEDYSYTDGIYEDGDSTTAAKGYYIGYYGSSESKKISKKTYDKAIKKLMPDKVKLETNIKNTKTNRSKYLGNLKEFKKYAK